MTTRVTSVTISMPPCWRATEKEAPGAGLSGLPGAGLRKVIWEVQVPRIGCRTTVNVLLPRSAPCRHHISFGGSEHRTAHMSPMPRLIAHGVIARRVCSLALSRVVAVLRYRTWQANSLRTGKTTGNFAYSRLRGRQRSQINPVVAGLPVPIPYSTEQGIDLPKQGFFTREQGSAWR